MTNAIHQISDTALDTGALWEMGLFMVAAAIAFSPPSARPLPRAATTTELRRSTLFMAEDVPPPVDAAVLEGPDVDCQLAHEVVACVVQR